MTNGSKTRGTYLRIIQELAEIHKALNKDVLQHMEYLESISFFSKPSLDKEYLIAEIRSTIGEALYRANKKIGEPCSYFRQEYGFTERCIWHLYINGFEYHVILILHDDHYARIAIRSNPSEKQFE